VTDPAVPTTSYLDLFGNQCSRLVAPQGRFALSSDAVLNDSGAADVVAPSAVQTAVEDLPALTLTYLLGSRYCETELLCDIAWQQSASVPAGWTRVQAICDFVHRHIELGYAHARHTRTAMEAHTERHGVCRDYAHLAIALCRCMNIPARSLIAGYGDQAKAVVAQRAITTRLIDTGSTPMLLKRSHAMSNGSKIGTQQCR